VTRGVKVFNMNVFKEYRQRWPQVEVSPQVYEQPELLGFHLDALDRYHAKHKRSLPARLLRGKPKTYEQALDEEIVKLPDPIQAELNKLLADRESATSSRFHYRAWEVVTVREQLKRRFANADPQEVKKHKLRFWKNKDPKTHPTEFFFVIRGKETKTPIDPLKGFSAFRRGGNPWSRADSEYIRQRNADVCRQRRNQDLGYDPARRSPRIYGTRQRSISPLPSRTFPRDPPRRRYAAPIRVRSVSPYRPPPRQPAYITPGYGPQPAIIGDVRPYGPPFMGPQPPVAPPYYDRYDGSPAHAQPAPQTVPYPSNHVNSYPASVPVAGVHPSWHSVPQQRSPCTAPPPPAPCSLCMPSITGFLGPCPHGLPLRYGPLTSTNLGPRFAGKRACQTYAGGPCSIPSCCHFHGAFPQQGIRPGLQPFPAGNLAGMFGRPRDIVNVRPAVAKKKKKSKKADSYGEKDSAESSTKPSDESSASDNSSRSRSRSHHRSRSGSRNRSRSSSSVSTSSSYETSIVDG
jgi:hypothetical protein